MQNSAEMLIVFPQGPARQECRAFINDCINQGVDIYFEGIDTLPTSVPPGIEGVRSIVLDYEDLEPNRTVLEEYKRKGAQVHVFNQPVSALTPQKVFSWANNKVFHQVLFSAALDADSPVFRQKMLARDEDRLFESLGERILKSNELGWYDATCYCWKGLLDGYELTGDQRYLDTAKSQIERAVAEEPNNCANCDCTAPFVPVLRLYEMTKNQALLDFVIERTNYYIENTPKWRGGFVNFNHQQGHVRSEIQYQVCPALMLLSQVSGDPKYADVALDQYIKLKEMLLDPETGLWHHGRNERTVSGAFWARGVAMVLYGLLQILEPMDTADPRYQTVLADFVEMADRLRKLQHSSGFWYHVVDNPVSEKESSGTAWIGVAYERGMRLGYLDGSYREAADLAWDAVKSRIWRGVLSGHMYATTVSHLYPYYLKNQLSTSGWAHFGFLLACERRRTRQEQK